MSYTNSKVYKIIEVGILCRSHQDHDNERAKEGDIIAMRTPSNVLGVSETKTYLWLRLNDYCEDDEHADLTATIIVGNKILGLAPLGTRYDKRRYCIPLNRLKQVYPQLNIPRVKDLTDDYQPFIVLDRDNNRFLAREKPLSIHGLVFDRERGVYL